MGADGPLSSEGGSPRRASVDNANVPVCRSFSSAWSRNECLEHVQRVSRDVARARECPPVPKCTRLVPARNRNLAFAGNTVCPFAGLLCKPSDGLEPSTPSLPWKFGSVTRGHTRSLATQFLLQVGPFEESGMRRKTSRVSFLMCPFCVRALLS
jgi:hypothetical protein